MWRIFHGEQWHVTPTSRLQQPRCRAVTGYWMIPFAAYTAAETPDALHWNGQPVGDFDRRLIHGSLGARESVFYTVSRSVQPFLQGSPMCPTDRSTHTITQITLRATSVINRSHLYTASMRCGLKQKCLHFINFILLTLLITVTGFRDLQKQKADERIMRLRYSTVNSSLVDELDGKWQLNTAVAPSGH